MRRVIEFAIVFVFVFSAVAVAAMWAGGANNTNQYGVYGTQGIASPQNMPGARRESATAVDAGGRLWLFGGFNGTGYLNDLWKFDGTNWIWVSGTRGLSRAGVYGTRGVASPDNMPGARGAAVSWVDRGGNFWLFGGSGYAAGTIWGPMNDLWKFDGTSWTWISGSSTSVKEHGGIYGTRGAAAGQNVPGARYGGVSWIDRSDNLWLFGGWGYDCNTSFGWLNDLWKFDGTSWTWVSGANIVNQSGFYGTQGMAAPENTPGSRWGSVSWVDINGNLWLFGGVGNWGMNFNDLWKFDGAYWTWIGGSNMVNQPGSYGTGGIAAPENVPGARDHSISWVDPNGNLWLFGGWSTAGFFNDLWMFDGANWAWMGGSPVPNQQNIYGSLAVASPENVPAARWADAAWIDGDGNLWLFGGWNTSGYFNDLWNLGSYHSPNLIAISP